MKTQQFQGMDGKFAGFARTIVAVLSIFFCGVLVMASLLGTTSMEIVTEGEGRDTVVQRIREQGEAVIFYQDDILLNVVSLIVGIALFWLFLRAVSRLKGVNEDKIFGWEIFLLVIWTVVFGCLWVGSSVAAPTEDSWTVSQAAWDFSKGDYHAITGENLYFHNFQYQLGFVLYEEILIRFASLFVDLDNLMVIQFASVFLLAFSYIALLLIAKCVFRDKRVPHVMTVLLAFCLQPILSCSFMYGIIPGFSLSAWAVYFELRFITGNGRKKQILRAALSVIFITAAVVVKTNNLITLIAMILLALVNVFGGRRNLGNLVLAVLCVISCVFAQKGVVSFYEKRADVDLGDSVPGISWFAMGMQEAENAPGWYNADAVWGKFESAGRDSDKASKVSWNEIQRKLNYFSADKQYRNDFYYKKFTSVWNETTYQSIWNNEVRGQYWAKSGIAAWACGDGEAAVRRYMDFYAQIIFIGVLAGTAVCWKRKNTLAMVMPLIMLGGMLYHLLAEAKSQYALPYFIWMTAFASCGIVWITDRITERLRCSASCEKIRACIDEGYKMICKREKEPVKKKFPKMKFFFAILAFLIPFFVGIIMFREKGIAPFGEQSLLNMDLWGQYFPMFVQQKKTNSFSGFIYSHNGALGYNNWTQGAYYCGSLFLLVLRLVPLENVVNVFDWLCLVKISISAVTCLIFLDYKIGKNRPALLVGAVSYSLCAYALAFMTQPMWTDALIYAPLVLLGLERLMREKKCLFYTLILALCIVSNFYIGYEVCIFTALYYLFNSLEFFPWKHKAFSKAERLEKIRNWGKMTGRFLLYSLLAGALTGVVIIPTVIALGNTAGAEKDGPVVLQWYNSWKTLLQMMLPEQSLKLGYTGDNISTGILAFVLLPVFFCNRQIGKKRKILQGLFLAFLLVSMNCNYLDYVWHGFRFPNQLPGRWTFLFSLLVVLLGSQGLAFWQGISLKGTVLGIGITTVLLMVLSKGAETPVGVKYYILAALAEGLLLGIALVNRGGIHKKEFRAAGRAAAVLTAGITVLATLDCGSSFLSVAKLEQGGLATSDGTGYQAAILRVSSYGEDWASGSDDFYRVEANSGFTFNSSMIGNYKGIGYYSSTMNGGVYKLLRYLGNRVYAENVSTVYNISAPVQNGLFGIRYFLDFDHNLTSKLSGLTLVQSEEDCDVYENPTALPVAYAVSEDAKNLQVTDEIRAIENQNKLLNCICGEEVNVYERMDVSDFGYDNCTLQENSDWNQNYYFTDDIDKPVVFHYTYRCEEDGPVYLEHNYRAGTITVQYGGTTTELSTGGQPFASLGVFAAGDEINIRVEANGIGVGCCGLNLYRLNTEKWEDSYEKLASQAVEIDTCRNTYMAGNITMEEEGLVLVTLSQDWGWSISCDGKTLETEDIAGAVIGVHVPKGTHRLEFTYHLPGLSLGIFISAAALLCLVFLQGIWLPYQRRTIKIKGE